MINDLFIAKIIVQLFQAKNSKATCEKNFYMTFYKYVFTLHIAWNFILSFHNKIKYLCILEVMPPQWSDFVLTADIPYGETDVFVFYSLHIKTWK